MKQLHFRLRLQTRRFQRGVRWLVMGLAIWVVLLSLLIGRNLVALGMLAGDLDPDFGNGGYTTINFQDANDFGNALAIAADGKLLIAGTVGGDIGVVRLDDRGMLDGGFGNGGKVITDLGGAERAMGATVQPDGRLIIVGSNGEDFLVIRYNPNGELDSSFGQDGVVTTDFYGADDSASDVLVQPDGMIVAVGTSTANSVSSFAVARYSSNGGLDQLFGNEGKRLLSLSAADSTADAVVLQADGRLTVVGATGGDTASVRLQADGDNDSSFGDNGVVVTDLGGLDAAHDAVIQSDDKLVLAATSGTDMVAVRYTADGQPDPSFGSAGTVRPQLGSASQGRAVALEPGGKIILAGTALNDSDDFVVVRYNTIGQLDIGFGANGVTQLDLGRDILSDMALDADQRIVITGSAFIDRPADFVAARFIARADSGDYQQYMPAVMKQSTP